MEHLSRVRILGQVYEIRWEPPADGSRGECDYVIKRIHVDPSYAPVEQADTLLHEILHGVVWGMKLGLSPSKEEKIVCALASGLTAVLQDNPQLRAYLLQDHNKE